ncbi:MAG TPA: hypothetical protein VFS42_02455 [Burkholderiaceae bacterium]|nr:hypothetical protein [Burkholderiaceae bacterium]
MVQPLPLIPPTQDASAPLDFEHLFVKACESLDGSRFDADSGLVEHRNVRMLVFPDQVWAGALIVLADIGEIGVDREAEVYRYLAQLNLTRGGVESGVFGLDTQARRVTRHVYLVPEKSDQLPRVLRSVVEQVLELRKELNIEVAKSLAPIASSVPRRLAKNGAPLGGMLQAESVAHTHFSSGQSFADRSALKWSAARVAPRISSSTAPTAKWSDTALALARIYQVPVPAHDAESVSIEHHKNAVLVRGINGRDTCDVWSCVGQLPSDPHRRIQVLASLLEAMAILGSAHNCVIGVDENSDFVLARARVPLIEDPDLVALRYAIDRMAHQAEAWSYLFEEHVQAVRT